MGTFSLMHWLVVGLVVLLLFGGRRIGDLGRGLGDGLRNFKKGLREEDEPKALPERSSDRTSDAKTS
jgi:sec-independent protein translocase protein TatA